MTHLSAKGISLNRGGRPILQGVDFDLKRGEFVGLIGPNGAGKTSLLHILAGLTKPDGGKINCDSSPLAAIPLADRARTISYLAQSDDVHWPMQADAVVALGRLPHRAASATLNHEAVARALELTDTAPYRDRSVDTLSGGERARVLLARALAVEAPLLLADEPIAALDPYHQLQIMELLHATARAGTGVLAVLHDLTLAHRFCDRLVLLGQGAVIAHGAPPDVLTDANIARAFSVYVKRGDAYVLPWSRIERPS